MQPATQSSPVQDLLARLEELTPLLRNSAAEADRLAQLPKRVAAARLDGSVGWAVMIGSGGGLFAAYLGSGQKTSWPAPGAICRPSPHTVRFRRAIWLPAGATLLSVQSQA
jgi:hypothetical protein